MTKSYMTAISRKTASAPLRRVLPSISKGSKILDYGCGKGADALYLSKIGHDVDSYDPYWNPIDLSGNESSYDFVLCTYVLNVLPEEDCSSVISSIRKYLNPNGVAYVSVRRDVKVERKTNRGYQRNVVLKHPVFYENAGNFCIYKISQSSLMGGEKVSTG